MSRAIGAMRCRVTLFRPVRTSDGALGYVRSDGDPLALWAEVRNATGKEIFRYQHLEQELTHSVTIRKRDNVKEGQYFRYGERDLYIMAVVNDHEGKTEFLKCLCREGGQV